MRNRFWLFTLALTLGTAANSHADFVALQNATATFSQTIFGGAPVAQAIDGSFAADNGWAISRGGGTNTSCIPETAVFETASDAGFAVGTALTFTMHQLFSSNPGHTIGRFRLSYTTDNRADFADGLGTGGDVTANWTVLSPLSATATGGATLTVLGDNSVLAGGTNPATSVFTVTAQTFLTGITGFRVEMLEDASLPLLGPGRFSTNGNFVLTEFEIDAVAIPEPGASLCVAFAALLLPNRRRQTGRHVKGP